MYQFLASYSFAAFVVSVAASKLVRLAAYVHLLPSLSFILYFPTFLYLDAFIICIVRLLYRPQLRGLLASTTFTFALLLSAITTFGASSQAGFFVRTGIELDWADAAAFVSNKNAIKVLLSGSWRVLITACFILVFAYFVHRLIFRGVDAVNSSAGSHLHQAVRLLVDERRAPRLASENDLEVISFLEKVNGDVDEIDYLDSDSELSRVSSAEPAQGKRWCCWTIAKGCIFAFLVFDLLLRPARPYRHLSETLPLALTGVLRTEVSYCNEQDPIMNNEWPLPELIGSAHWKQPSGHFKGWAPDSDSELSRSYREWSPSWASKKMPRGFSRWELPGDEKRSESWEYLHLGIDECPNVDWKETPYSPVEDPLRITNLDTEILEPVREALNNGSVRIKHVVYILMESLRPEFFPLQVGSDIHKAILDLSPPEDRAMYNERLAHLTPHIEKITGVSGGFVDNKGQPIRQVTQQWNDTTEKGNGGINVIGGYTAATMSTKSFAANHCGAWPMPVEKFDEADTDSYQPCMPQILNFWSGLKSEGQSRSQDFRNQTWVPALFEAMVEAYDRQEVFDQHIGFKHIVTRENLEEAPDFNPRDPKFQKVNYFGYAEQVLKPHIKEYITNAVENDQRIWLSHFTSTTHHAWSTPDWFEDMEFMPPGRFPPGHRDFNRYLNTIRFHDAWMGELMQLLDDLGIANETLVVFAGDHGTAFSEDDGHQGTYGNPHISNLRVPITFRHPHLPRVQYHANATTISTLPTILDLLIHSGSLNEEDSAIASDLIHEYEGQSLIRPYKTSDGARRAWNFAVINSGAKMVAVTSADAPWMLVIPFTPVFPYRLADLDKDPLELDPIVAWSTEAVTEQATSRFGSAAAKWAREAEVVGKWWADERKRLWKYHLRQQPTG